MSKLDEPQRVSPKAVSQIDELAPRQLSKAKPQRYVIVCSWIPIPFLSIETCEAKPQICFFWSSNLKPLKHQQHRNRIADPARVKSVAIPALKQHSKQ